MKVIKENSSTRLKRSLFGDASKKIKTFGIMTAENPMGKEASAEYNNKAQNILKQLLKQMNIQYIKQIGSFGNKEHSLMLINVSLKDMKYLNDKFKQMSFFHGVVSEDGSSISYYEKPSEDSDYELIETTDSVVNARDFLDFFSSHGDFKYSIDLDYFKEELDTIPSIKDEDSMLEALDDNYTMKHRVNRRALAYNGKRLK